MDPLLLYGLAWLLGSKTEGQTSTKTEPEEKPKRPPRKTTTTTTTRATTRPTPAPAPARAPAAKKAQTKTQIKRTTTPATVAKPATTTVTTTTVTKKTEPTSAVPASTVTSTTYPLERRANQKRARDWLRDLENHGAKREIAIPLTRWIGIESSGEPLALSKIGERGLLQSTKTTALKEKLFTPDEWAELQSPATSRAEHARLALKQLAFHIARARRWVANPPPLTSPDWLWYAKLHHTRPKDLSDAKPHGPALPMAKDLWGRAVNDKALRQRLAMANVVAFGRVVP